jgi:hypothetical protein
MNKWNGENPDLILSKPTFVMGYIFQWLWDVEVRIEFAYNFDGGEKHW